MAASFVGGWGWVCVCVSIRPKMGLPVEKPSLSINPGFKVKLSDKLGLSKNLDFQDEKSGLLTYRVFDKLSLSDILPIYLPTVCVHFKTLFFR